MANARARHQLAGYGLTHSRTAEGRSSAPLAWAIWLLFLANGGVIVWLWWRDGGVSGVHSPADLLTSVGRVTGLLGAYLLLIQVLLLARLLPIERQIGFDRLTVWHRRNGKLCLYLVLAHVVFITAGYTLTDRISLRAEVTTLLGSYPGMIAATVGTVLLIVVVLSSLVIVRRRLRYEAWYLVHLTAYAAILLGWFHQIPTGNELTANPAAAAYWTALYLATLGLLVLFRAVRPGFLAFWHGLRVAEVIPEGPNAVSLRIEGRHLDALNARPGQFFLWRFLTRGRWWESHPFSLSRAPDGRSLRITVKSSGDFTRSMGEVKPGTLLLAEGPFGAFTEAKRRKEGAVLIAGGIGITPIRALLETMRGDLVLIYRALRDGDIVFRTELDRLARERGLTIHYVVGDHAAPGGERLLSPGHLCQLVPDIAGRDVYICGPPAMSSAIEGNVRRAGVPRRSIHTERFSL